MKSFTQEEIKNKLGNDWIESSWDNSFYRKKGNHTEHAEIQIGPFKGIGTSVYLVKYCTGRKPYGKFEKLKFLYEDLKESLKTVYYRFINNDFYQFLTIAVLKILQVSIFYWLAIALIEFAKK